MDFDEFLVLLDKGTELPFDKIHQAMTSYIAIFVECNVSPPLKSLLLELIQCALDYLSGKIDGHALLEARTTAWHLFDRQERNSPAQFSTRLVLCCLYDEQSSEIDEMGLEFFFETLFSIADDAAENESFKFARYLADHLELV
ncbi:hypothetical protein ABHF33_12015 [Chitinibacter sp. FCG-7]|uniref:Uncharacterized protein n=1 Tax=Chitinibacter mangrovi TaxID=3153927 RepID=A0AAU7F6Z0_9NEIS